MILRMGQKKGRRFERILFVQTSRSSPLVSEIPLLFSPSSSPLVPFFSCSLDFLPVVSLFSLYLPPSLYSLCFSIDCLHQRAHMITQEGVSAEAKVKARHRDSTKMERKMKEGAFLLPLVRGSHDFVYYQPVYFRQCSFPFSQSP